MKNPKRTVFPGPYVADTDAPYMHSVQLPLGDWAYLLDDAPGLYGPGWYPFHRENTRREPDPRNQVAHVGRDVLTNTTSPCSVRISPDVDFRSWGNEYVTLWSYGADARVLAHMNLFVEHGHVRRVNLGIDLRKQRTLLPEGIPDSLMEQAETKGQRILDFLNRARAERRRGVRQPHDVAHTPMRANNA